MIKASQALPLPSLCTIISCKKSRVYNKEEGESLGTRLAMVYMHILGIAYTSTAIAIVVLFSCRGAVTTNNSTEQ